MVDRLLATQRGNVRAIASAVGWRVGRLLPRAPRPPIVLMYHGTPPRDVPGEMDGEAFERQIRFLRAHVDFVFPEQLDERSSAFGRPRVLLTFDDGFANNAEIAAPILRRYGIPAVFFVANRHSAPGRYLWFAYLRALEHAYVGPGFAFRGQFMDMAVGRRGPTLARLRSLLISLRPHPLAMYQAIEDELPPLERFMDSGQIADVWSGMNETQVADLAADPLFRVGAHTVDHPYLTMCEPDEATRQLAANKAWIEAISGRPCDLVAYPLGDYDARVVTIVRALGFRQGFAVAPRRVGAPELEVGRIGVYRPSLDELGTKVVWGPALRRLGRPIG